MTCAILELDLKKKKSGILELLGICLTRKITKKSTKSLVKIQLFKCYLITNWNVQVWNMWTIDKPSALDCGLERSAVQIPTFAKLYIGTVGFTFIFCSCVVYRCLNTCKNNPHMFHFKLFALFWYLFKWSSTHRGRGRGGCAYPGEQYSKTLLTTEKEYTLHKLCCTS